MNNSALSKFRKSQIFGMTLAATTQRSRLYAVNPTDTDKKTFHRSFRAELESLCATYAHLVPEKAHLNNIEALADSMSDQHSNIFKDGRMRIGHAQKALNLHLKYFWCFGLLPEPPHCPIDSVILRLIPGFGSVRWTKLDSISDYAKIIGAARRVAGQKNQSLSQWELSAYNEFVA